MKLAIIGAAGFVGAKLTQMILQRADLQELRLLDVTEFTAPNDPRIRVWTGDFSDPVIRENVVEGVHKVIVLAAILGGAAEANYNLARKTNVDAMLDLFEYLRAQDPKTRVVSASTIGVFGTPMPAIVDDTTATGPSMVYGAQKLMMEVALSHFAARGWLDGVSLRPSGVMARDGADARLKTAFMSRLFYAVKRGEEITLPVAADSQTWLTSVENVANNFMHAAMIENIGPNRAFTLPALVLTFEQLVTALYRRYPDSNAKVRYDPDPALVLLFGSFPALNTETADRLGFSHDFDVDELVAKALD